MEWACFQTNMMPINTMGASVFAHFKYPLGPPGPTFRTRAEGAKGHGLVINIASALASALGNISRSFNHNNYDIQNNHNDHD